MNYKITILFLLLSFVGAIHLTGQQEILKTADSYFMNKIYAEALAHYQRSGVATQREDIQYKLGVCNFELNDTEKAKSIFDVLAKRKYKEKKVHLYLGLIAHNDSDFEQAIGHYKDYLRHISKNHQDRKMIIGMVKRCSNGIKLKYQNQKSFIENMGPDINSSFDEFGVVQSKNFDSRFYFTSNRSGSIGGKRNKEGLKDEMFGTYNTDMYVVEDEEGIWTDVEPLGGLINSPQNDILHGFNQDGSVMFFSKKLVDETTHVLVDTFREDRSADHYPSKFLAKIRGDLGDNYLYVYNDSTILFSSKRIGGYGGYDIYVTQKRKGRWTDPYNLGPQINTSYDEISPFLSNDGRKLYFSSNNESSIGGFDVFESNFLPEQFEWLKYKNIGLPVNSGSNDTHYSITRGGKTALFSSDRKNGYGGTDIYIAYLKEEEVSHLTNQLSEVIFIPEEDNEAVELVEKPIIEEPIDKPNATIKTREYVISPLYYGDDELLLTPNNKRQIDALIEMMKIYPKIKIELACNTAEEGINAYELYFSIKRTEEVVEYLKRNGVNLSRIHIKGLGNNYPYAKEVKDGGSARLSQRTNRRIDIIVHNTSGLPLIINMDYPNVPDELKDYKFAEYRSAIEGLSYKVQIVKVNQLYQNEILNNYNDATIEKDLSNNTYIYTLGLYNRYATARVLQDELINSKFKSAEVIPYVDGLRINKNALSSFVEDHPDLQNYINDQKSE